VQVEEVLAVGNVRTVNVVAVAAVSFLIWVACQVSDLHLLIRVIPLSVFFYCVIELWRRAEARRSSSRDA
jgi:hypothetical protein